MDHVSEARALHAHNRGGVPPVRHPVTPPSRAPEPSDEPRPPDPPRGASACAWPCFSDAQSVSLREKHPSRHSWTFSIKQSTPTRCPLAVEGLCTPANGAWGSLGDFPMRPPSLASHTLRKARTGTRKLLSRFDYEERARMRITGRELIPLLREGKAQLLDIRFREEKEAWRMGFGIHIPLNELPDRLEEPAQEPAHGNRLSSCGPCYPSQNLLGFERVPSQIAARWSSRPGGLPERRQSPGTEGEASKGKVMKQDPALNWAEGKAPHCVPLMSADSSRR